MPALSILKNNWTRARNALTKEEYKKLIKEASRINQHKIMKYSLSIGKSILSLETKLTWLDRSNQWQVDGSLQRTKQPRWVPCNLT